MTLLDMLFEDMLADSTRDEAHALVRGLDLDARLVRGWAFGELFSRWFVGEDAGSRAELYADGLTAESGRTASVYVVNREEGWHKIAIAFAPHCE